MCKKLEFDMYILFIGNDSNFKSLPLRAQVERRALTAQMRPLAAVFQIMCSGTITIVRQICLLGR
jgi:hypothetical protein